MSKNRYSSIIEKIFFLHYQEGDREVEFKRTDIEIVAKELGIKLLTGAQVGLHEKVEYLNNTTVTP